MGLLDRFLWDTVEICETAAPTGREEDRGRLLRDKLAGAGVPAATDEAGNVVGEISGDPALPCVAYAAHLDTVFPDESPIDVREEGGYLHAPGIGDNSAGVASLLVLAREIPAGELGRILLVGTVSEEGNGDLRGARHLCASRGSEIDAVLAVEGAMRDRIVAAGMGAERLRVTVRGPGGHSWGDAGAPSAIGAAATLISELYAIPLPDEPKTTLNVGTIRGGNSVNSIAEEAVFDLDLRSLDQETVAAFRQRVIDHLAGGLPEEGPLTVETERIGSRPAGSLLPGHPLLAQIRTAREEAGLPPAEEVTSSTDANIPLSLGIPAACVGIGLGENTHKRSERLAVAGIEEGLLGLLTAARRIGSDPTLVRRSRTE